MSKRSFELRGQAHPLSENASTSQRSEVARKVAAALDAIKGKCDAAFEVYSRLSSFVNLIRACSFSILPNRILDQG